MRELMSGLGGRRSDGEMYVNERAQRYAGSYLPSVHYTPEDLVRPIPLFLSLRTLQGWFLPLQGIYLCTPVIKAR